MCGRMSLQPPGVFILGRGLVTAAKPFQFTRRRLACSKHDFISSLDGGLSNMRLHLRADCDVAQVRFGYILVTCWYQRTLLRRVARIEGSRWQVLLGLDRRVDDDPGELCFASSHMCDPGACIRQESGRDGPPQKLSRWCCGFFCGSATKSAELDRFCLHPRLGACQTNGMHLARIARVASCACYQC